MPVGAELRITFRLLEEPSVSNPVTTNWSEAESPTSMASVPSRPTSASVRVPAPLPGESVAPAMMFTGPAIRPPPPSVAPEKTSTLPDPVADPLTLLASSVPAWTNVPLE